jgi:hypothetical protein
MNTCMERRPHTPSEPGLAVRESSNACQLEETEIPLVGWYFAFRIDPQATLPNLRDARLSTLRDRRKTYVAFLLRVSRVSFSDEGILD